jgi:hypothetical protein
MTILHPPKTGPSISETPDAEALIQEARRLRRRRWIIGTAAVVVLAMIGGGLAVSLNDRSPRSARIQVASKPEGPSVNVRGFRDQGRLAFISKGKLFLLDGNAATLRALPSVPGFSPADPVMSPDGRWLAYTETRSANSTTTAQLWVARGDGADAHVVRGLSVGDFVGWSPTDDELAVGANSTVTFSIPNGSTVTDTAATKIDLVSPSGRVHQLVALPANDGRPLQLSNANWAPDGSAVAVATWAVGDDGPAAIKSYPISGAVPTTWFSISATAKLPGICTGCGGANTVPTIAGWWKGWGIGFWVTNSGATRNLDDTPLELVTAPGAVPHIIGDTLSDGSTVAFATDSRGDLALVSSTGGREYGSGKAVEVCRRASESCTAIPDATVWNGKPLPCPPQGCAAQPAPGTPGSGVTIDPSWSPGGKLLAYENAPVVPNDVVPIDEWYDSHELFIWTASSNSSRKIADLSGASVPTWSRDGKDLLYVDNDALWLWPSTGGNPRQIVAPLFPKSEWKGANGTDSFSFFEQVDWINQFSWWSK